MQSLSVFDGHCLAGRDKDIGEHRGRGQQRAALRCAAVQTDSSVCLRSALQPCRGQKEGRETRCQEEPPP